MLIDIAKAKIKGGKKYPNINGIVNFRETSQGVIITAKIYNLPTEKGKCNNKIFGFHIHEGTQCIGNKEDEFANAKAHYNPENCSHPHHAGDLPPLFGNDGYAYMNVLTNRIKLKDVIGKAIIIHSMPDDFTSQPSGNSGEKIACGIIKRQIGI